jgi:anaerobic selenocysteine-containing dehydrogenase
VVAEQRQSACPLDCPDLCGLTVTVDNGKVIEINGDRRNPITDGFICGKVRKFAHHMYGDDRLARPLLRTGPKGVTRSGQFREATWTEAIDVIEQRMRESIAKHGAESILPYHYGGSNGWLTEGALATRFFRRLGASNLDRTFCAAASTAATQGLYAVIPGVALEDYTHAKLIVLWGVNPAATGIHLVPVIERAKDMGAKLVVVDPRRTQLAKHADMHLAIRPGADLPVALAIANRLFDRGLAATEWLAQHANGVDEFRKRCAKWSLFDAAREAGVSAGQLEEFVDLYVESSPAVIRAGWGLERNRNGGGSTAAVLALPAIAGKFGVRGGGYTMANSDAKWGVNAEMGIAQPAPPTRTINMSGLSRALVDLDPPISTLFVYNCNPAVTAPDQRVVLEQLARDDLFVVVHDQVMTDTAELADVVLPATTFLEHRELRRGYGMMRMFDSPAVAAPFGESRSNNQLFDELMQRFGLHRPGDAITDDAIVEHIFASAPEGSALREQLRANTVAIPSSGTHPIAFVDVFPNTPDRKMRLVPEHLDAQVEGGLYAYVSDPGTSDYPLALISPALATQISSTFGQLRSAPAVLEMSRADAAARGISDGDAIRIFNEHGEVHCTAKIEADVRDGVCVLPKGLWRKHTANGFTSNALIPPRYADLAGQAAWNDARVQVAKR